LVEFYGNLKLRALLSSPGCLLYLIAFPHSIMPRPSHVNKNPAQVFDNGIFLCQTKLRSDYSFFSHGGLGKSAFL
jgi:hypothetical protein